MKTNQKHRSRISFAYFMNLAGAFVMTTGSLVLSQTTERISVSTDGTPSNVHAEYPAIAAGGRYVVFESISTNLVPNDLNGFRDIFVRDLQTDTTTRVSLTSAGVEADGNSNSASISGDGRYVVFVTGAPNIAPFADFFFPVVLHDRQTGQTTAVSVDFDGFPVSAWDPDISADGRFIAYSTEGRIIASDTNNTPDIYCYEISSGNSLLMSVTQAGALADFNSFNPSLSADGASISFESFATNLIGGGDTNGVADVYARDTNSVASITRVSVATGGVQVTGASGASSISGNGRFVVFTSSDPNLTGGDINGFNDVFVHDRQTATTTLVSVSSSGFQTNNWLGSGDPATSADGQLVLFSSFADNLVSGDTNFRMDLFLRDRTSGQTTRVSVATDGTQGDFDSPSNTSGIGGDPGMSANGGQIVFDSFAGNLVPGDAPFNVDIFLVNADRDGDGLLDDWEDNGVPYRDGSTVYRYMLSGADPDHKDLYVEVDSMVSLGFNATAQANVINAFAQAPNALVDNPDGNNGITLHLVVDETNLPVTPFPNGFTEFDTIKSTNFGTPTERGDPNWATMEVAKKKAYRYCIFGHSHGTTTSSGLAERPGNDFMVTLGLWSTPGGTINQQAGTFMHEFGHALNLRHGGGDDIHRKPNYYSVMNYTWQNPKNSYAAFWRLDFSHVKLADLDESALSENAGIDGSDPAFAAIQSLHGTGGEPPVRAWARADGTPVDWNKNGAIDAGTVAVDISYLYQCDDPPVPCPSPGELLEGHADWPNLQYVFEGASFADGVHDSTTQDTEMTLEMFEQMDDTPPLPGVCLADLSGDSVVDVVDLIDMLAGWGTPSGDIDGDGDTNVDDLIDFLAAWGPCP